MTSPRHPDLLPISNVALPSLGHIAIQTMNCSNGSFHGTCIAFMAGTLGIKILGLRHELQFPENPNTPRETLTVQLTGFSSCLLQNVEKKHLWGLHTKVTFQGDCVSCKELLGQKALVLDNHLHSFLTKKTSMPDWMAPPLQKQ